MLFIFGEGWGWLRVFKLNNLLVKIAFYISSLTGGGAEKVFATLANYLVSINHLVYIVLNKDKGPNLDLINSKVHLHILKSEISRRSVLELRSFIISFKPDVCISTLSHCNYALILANLLSGRKTKVIAREANSFISQRKSMPFFRLFYENIRASILYRFADKVIVNSEGSKIELSKAICIDSMKIKILFNPVNEEQAIRLSRDELTGNLKDFFDGMPVIIGIGRLEANKDYKTLIKAFSILNNKYCKLLILGEGSLRCELEELIKSLKLEKRVCMPGYLNNPYNALSKSKVFILSSIYEGMPNSLIEALILGIPVVSTDCPNGPRELLMHGKYGVLVSPSNPSEMALAIEKQLSDDKIIPKKEMFEAYFVHSVGDQFLNLVSSIL